MYLEIFKYEMFHCYYKEVVLKQSFFFRYWNSITFHVKTFHPSGRVRVENGHLGFPYLCMSLVHHLKNAFSVLNKLFGRLGSAPLVFFVLFWFCFC